MKKPMLPGLIASLLILTPLAMTAGAHDFDKYDDDSDRSEVSADATGLIQTINANGRTNTKGAFFQSLGTNGRSCSTCHLPDQAMSIAPPQIRQRFEQTRGRDPLFNAVDGANCANASSALRWRCLPMRNSR
jgi:hypothetical protein